MNFRWRSTVGLAVLSGLAALAGCGDDDDANNDGGGTGGVTAGTANGGTSGGGTAGANGGTAGSSGGSAGKGGTAGSGGTAGKGGTAGTAGKAGSGNAGEGGTDDGVGGAGPESCTTTVDGLLLHSFDAPGSSAGWGVKVNLGTPPDAQLGDASSARDPLVGHTCPGSLRLDVPFSAYAADANSSVTAEINYSPAKAFPFEAPTGAGGAGGADSGVGGDGAGGAGADGKWPILHVWVKVENASKNVLFLGGAQPYVNTAAYSKYANKFHNIDTTWNDGTWHELVLDFATVCATGGYCSAGIPDPATVLQLGVEFIARKVAADGAPAAPTASKIYLDDIWVE